VLGLVGRLARFLHGTHCRIAETVPKGVCSKSASMLPKASRHHADFEHGGIANGGTG